jgi:hypothetical protein
MRLEHVAVCSLVDTCVYGVSEIINSMWTQLSVFCEFNNNVTLHICTYSDSNTCAPPSQVKAGNLGEKYRLIREAVILVKSPWPLFHILGEAGAVTGQM